MQWLVLVVAIDIATTIGWAIETFTFDTQIMRWPGQVTALCVGTASVLVFCAVPIVLAASSASPPPTTATARVVESAARDVTRS